MDEQLYRFSTNQKHKDEFSRERAMESDESAFYALSISW